MKYTANCPACNHEFEIAGIAAAKDGLKCPKCATGFVPEKVHRSDELEQKPAWEVKVVPNALTPEDRLKRRRDGITNVADNFSSVALLFLILGIILLFVSVMRSLDGAEVVLGWIISCGLIGTAFWMYLVAQIIHIRANTEK
jgi:hypothetical protein